MDSGFLAEGDSFEDQFDVQRELLPEEVIGLMDQMLCHEVRARPFLIAIVAGSDISDADLRFPRWHGTWVIRSQHPSSRLTILTGCCGLNLRNWKMPALTGLEDPTRAMDFCTLYFEHTV